MTEFLEQLTNDEVEAIESIIGEKLSNLPDKELDVLSEMLYRRKRNASIRKDANELQNKGVDIKTTCTILHRVYYLSPSYIQLIIYLK